MSGKLQWVVAAAIALASLAYARLDHGAAVREAQAKDYARVVTTVDATHIATMELRESVRQLESLVLDLRFRLADTEAVNRFLHGEIDP